jgi:hypothetical protein
MNTRNGMPNTIASVALAALLMALLPSAACTAPLDDGSNVPIAQGEAPARSCYLHARELQTVLAPGCLGGYTDTVHVGV